MSSDPEQRLRPLSARAFGLRHRALWYATLFILGSLASCSLTYVLLATSLAQRDRQIINQKLGEYAAAYQRGGLDLLANTVQRGAAHRARAAVRPRRRSRRRSDRAQQPGGMGPEQLETATLHLVDGTLVQVGKSTDAREDLLARFRAVLGVVTLSIVVIALTGGIW